MAYWSQSLSDKICSLYHKFLPEMIEVSQSIISDEDIKAFVKYRNDVTHGRHRIMTEKIARTAYSLSGLIYCCFLTRIGISTERIKTLFQNGNIIN